MKVKLDEQAIRDILADPEKARNAKIKASDPWWVIALKVAAYLIGLILAGITTTSCANLAGII